MPSRRSIQVGLAAFALALVAASCAPVGPVATPAVRSSTAAQSVGPAAQASLSPAASGAIAPASSIVPGSIGRTSIALAATYDVALSLDYGDRRLAATSTMTVTNTSGGPIDRIELEAIAARLGHLALGPVTVDGRPVVPTVADQTITVPLGGVLPAGAVTRLQLSFRATLRSDLAGADWLFTRTNGIIDAYRWLPWVSLARPFGRPNYGDPFYTASSPSVRVAITTDRPLVIAATGRQVSAVGLTQTFEAHDVRDFTITASPDYTVSTAHVGSTTVRLYARPGFPSSAVMGYATSALRREGVLAGVYPYGEFSVAQSAGGDGMESPELIWLPREAAGSHLRWLTFHETAHQWFYGLVGSDQARQPFADEAAADMLARTASGIWRVSRCPTARLDRSIYAYTGRCYFEIVYVQGSGLLDEIRARMGSTAFWAAIRGYIAAHHDGLGGTRLLLEALEAGTPLNLRPLYAPRFPSLF
ncbi:MAG TPA: hypothetical protein VIM30_00545 [Candidatus Limnocylindrales bacterium]|jgi:hypothetical protein